MGRELQPGLPPEGEGGWHATTARADNNSAGEDDVVRGRPAAWLRAGGGAQANGLSQPDGPPPVAECVAIALIPQVRADLQRLQDRTNLSQTDITNRAITLYEFIDAQLRAGRELLIRDESTGEIQRVHIT
jgi:hypothetical protein